MAEADPRLDPSATDQSLAERAFDKVPPGSLAPVSVYGSLAVGLAASLATKRKEPLEAVISGLSGGAVGNSLNSLVGHRQGAHESVKTSPNTNRALRAMTAAWGGAKTRAVAMHRRHHPTTETPEDPHSPQYMGRWKVFSGLVGITEKFERDNPDLITELQDSEYTEDRPYETTATLVAGTVAMHAAIGKARGHSNGAILASSAMHLSLIYLQNAIYTADVHPQSEGEGIKKFGYDPLVNAIYGSEDGHDDHHEDPGNPRHSRADLVYAAALGLRKLGLAEIPRLDGTEDRVA